MLHSYDVEITWLGVLKWYNLCGIVTTCGVGFVLRFDIYLYMCHCIETVDEILVGDAM